MNIYENIRNELNTGDIILFSGRALFSRIVQIGTRSPWSHIGIVVRFTTPFDFVALWESDITIGGVQLTNLSARIKKYKGQVVVRHLEGTSLGINEINIFHAVREELKLRPYQVNKFEMIRAAYDKGLWLAKAQEKDISSLFCSELVAETLQRIGILNPDLSSNEFTPGDFDENAKLDMIRGNYGPKIVIKQH
jgi:hypothetical protein